LTESDFSAAFHGAAAMGSPVSPGFQPWEIFNRTVRPEKGESSRGLTRSTRVYTSDLAPFQGAKPGRRVPRVETLGFYEAADFVKTRWTIVSFIFDSFWPTSDNTSPFWLWCLIFAMRGFPSAAMIKHQSQ
jgi:hypothetical protein